MHPPSISPAARSGPAIEQFRRSQPAPAVPRIGSPTDLSASPGRHEMPTKNARTPAKNVWSDEERAAMQASARERKASAKRSPEEERAEGLQDLRDSLAKMPPDDRAMGERIHEIVTGAAPELSPKTY